MTNSSISARVSYSKSLYNGARLLQVVLASFFGMVGFMKLTTPIDTLVVHLPWVLDYSPFLVRFIGLTEILGALGLIIPAATRIKPNVNVVVAAIAYFIGRTPSNTILVPAWK